MPRVWNSNNKKEYEKQELQRIRLIRIRPTITWKKCNPVRKKNTQLETESLIDKPMLQNSLSCKLMNVQASMKDNNEKIFDEHEISLLIKAFPKDIAALDKRSVLAKVNSQGSGI